MSVKGRPKRKLRADRATRSIVIRPKRRPEDDLHPQRAARRADP